MARIVVVGAGVVALGTAMLLAGDGHQVTLLERDPEGPPDDPGDAWEHWQRPGLNQFRMAHVFLGGFRQVVDAELPGVATALQDAGALRLNFMRGVLPASMSGGWRDGDERYEWLTGRRVLMEAMLAAAAESTPGVRIRRGTAVTGSVPPLMGSTQIPWGTLTSLTLPADNGTWSIALVASAKDTALRALREAGRWEAVVRGLPLVAHWLDGAPIDDGVAVMARLEDRYRGFVVDGKPVATGVVALADSWACSNPANGRGTSVGMLHALVLRDQLRAAGLDDPAAFAEAFHAATAETVEPWYRATRRRSVPLASSFSRWLPRHSSSLTGRNRRRLDGAGGRQRRRDRVRGHRAGAAGGAAARLPRLRQALAASGAGAGRRRVPGDRAGPARLRALR
jgi:2-polyprenyl-6-methoxyphenol hydroxylase-like FAD-dependent oxidoreductase